MEKRRRKFWLLAILVLFSVTFSIFIYGKNNIPEFNQYKLVREYQQKYKGGSGIIRTILLWNRFFESRRWGLPDDTVGPAFFQHNLSCPVYNCELTINHSFLPDVTMFDAIVFHTAEHFPFYRPVPARRHHRQFYVFALLEPPGETKHILKDELHFYNYTMTYRLDSDVRWTYQTVYDIESGRVIAPAEFPIWRTPSTEWNDTTVMKFLPGKTRMAAWFVSHCPTPSEREKLTEALQKFIDVDVYGYCGDMFCRKGRQECDDKLDRTYKFYLSFENSLCTDYVTEKLYNALKRQLIPVVFGGADYQRFAPPHSYINAESFDSVEELAQYLRYLSAHPAEYLRYFWWRRYYRLAESSPFCELCEKLHSVTSQQKTQVYKNIERWWIEGSCRFKSNLRF